MEQSKYQTRYSIVFWIGLTAFIVLSWLALAYSHVDMEHHKHHEHHMLQHGYLSMLGAWMLMGVAMMLPTALPLLKDYELLVRGKSGYFLMMLGIVFGYISLWLFFAFPASVLQYEFLQKNLLSEGGTLSKSYLSASVLIITGMYQFSPLKQACVSRCRNSTAFLLSYWRAGIMGALRLGVLHGVFCVGCCWALMLLGFVTGLHSLLWMGIATGFMLLEKLPKIGKYLDRPAGLILICWGVSYII